MLSTLAPPGLLPCGTPVVTKSDKRKNQRDGFRGSIIGHKKKKYQVNMEEGPMAGMVLDYQYYNVAEIQEEASANGAGMPAAAGGIAAMLGANAASAASAASATGDAPPATCGGHGDGKTPAPPLTPAGKEKKTEDGTTPNSQQSWEDVGALFEP